MKKEFKFRIDADLLENMKKAAKTKGLTTSAYLIEAITEKILYPQKKEVVPTKGEKANFVPTNSEVMRKGVTPKRVNAKNSSKRVNLSDWGI